MGNPSVRFDEGRERVGHWPWPFNPSSPAYSTTEILLSLCLSSAYGSTPVPKASGTAGPKPAPPVRVWDD